MNRFSLIVLLALLQGALSAVAQPIIMSNTSTIQEVTEDVRYFYDPGGPNGDFGLGIRDTLTMRNAVTGPGRLVVTFNEFAMGYGDTLYIFEGQGCDNASLIGYYNSVYSPEEITTYAGYLTFVFHSDSIDDYGILKSGWSASVYVVPSAPEVLSLTDDWLGVTVMSCNAKFYDSGGPTGNMTYTGGTRWCEFSSPVSHVKMEFQSFNVAGVMKIYDGSYNDPNRRLIGQFHSTTVDATIGSKPPVLFSSGSTLTVEYVSAAGDVSKPGWEATITCVPELFESPDGSACPKVVSEDEYGVEMPDTIHHLCGVPVIVSAHVTATGRYTNDYTVRQIAYNPPFPFNQGTQITADVDDNWVPYSSGQTQAIATQLPFIFSFFGKTYSSVYPGANGLISFSNPNSTYCAWDSRTCPTSQSTPPYAAVPYLYRNCIYGVMEDVYPSYVQNGGAIRYGVMGAYPCRTFVFNYDNIGLFSCWSSGAYNSYQMVIYEGTNIIDVFIRHREPCESWNNGNGVVGIQNATSAQMVIAPGRDFSPNWTANNEAWRFTPITPMDEDAEIEWFANTVSPATSVGHTKKIVLDPQETTDYIVKYHFTNASDSLFDLYDTIHVIVDVPDLSLDTFTVCPGKTVTLIPIFGDTSEVHPQDYLWSTSATSDTISIIARETQEYELKVLFDNNCQRTARTIVHVDTMAVPVITGDSSICYGERVRMVATVDDPSYILRWGNGMETDVLVVQPSDTSTFTIKAVLPTDEECFTTDTFTVNVKPIPQISFTYTPESVVIERGSGTLTCHTDCDPNYNIVWNFNDRYNPENSIVEGQQSVTYEFTHVGSYDITLSATNEYECSDSVTEHVRVYVPVSFIVPNAFTPNDDGLNDVFVPVYEGVELTQYLMLVYDRQGRIVFKSTNLASGWDGRDLNGQLCPQGVYTYYIRHWTQMDDLRGAGQPVVSGGVTLIR
mgnify:CR=1 FL=1